MAGKEKKEPRIVAALSHKLSKFGYDCTYNHDTQRLKVVKDGHYMRVTLAFLKDRGVTQTSNILISNFIDFKQECK